MEFCPLDLSFDDGPCPLLDLPSDFDDDDDNDDDGSSEIGLLPHLVEHQFPNGSTGLYIFF